jgi:Tfp pilus assembly protein PilO
MSTELVIQILLGIIIVGMGRWMLIMHNNIKEERKSREENEKEFLDAISEEREKRNMDFRELSDTINQHAKWPDVKEFVREKLKPMEELLRTINQDSREQSRKIDSRMEGMTAAINNLIVVINSKSEKNDISLVNTRDK